MANEVYANSRELACKAGNGKSICCFPDVCLSPPSPPAGPVPIPYPNTGLASDTTDGSKTVQISGKEIMLKNKSYFKTSTGDEAATKSLGMGVVTHQIQGKVYFAAWSMDVKFEGENVVRHLDQTTHNHASGPPNTGPWPFTDSQAVSPGGACDKESKAIKESGKCNTEDPASDTSAECCSVPERKCILVPKKDDKKKCCAGQTTGHHALPKQELCKVGTAGDPLPTNKLYNHEAAPTICVEGHYHRSREDNGELKEHGLFGNAYKQGRADWLEKNPGKTYDYQAASGVAAESVQKETNGVCSKECIQNQLDNYHQGKVNEVRVSQQYEFEPVKPARTATGTGP